MYLRGRMKKIDYISIGNFSVENLDNYSRSQFHETGPSFEETIHLSLGPRDEIKYQ